MYRLLTSPFIHGGLLHIAFNMMAFVPIGCSLERTMGTLALTYLVGLLIFLGAGIYIALATAAAATALRYGCSVFTVTVTVLVKVNVTFTDTVIVAEIMSTCMT